MSPWRNNALHYYRSALRVDSELTVAQRGIREVEHALMAQARGHYSTGDWSAAEDAAEDVLKINSDSAEAQQFLVTLEQRQRGELAAPQRETQNRSVSLSEGVPVDFVATEGPRIQQLRVDGKLLSGMNARQLQAVQAQRRLFVSFEYQDFPPGQTQLEATLGDAQGESIAEVFVVVTASNGLQRFRFERPGEPFSPGEYQLSLSLRGTALIRADFLIQ